jgi:hypothetical protein
MKFSNDMLLVNFSQGLSPPLISIAAWVMLDDNQPDAKIISKPYRNLNIWTPPYISYSLGTLAGTRLPATQIAVKGGILKTEVGTSSLPSNTWCHLVMTFNGTHLYLYRDGVLEGFQMMNATTIEYFPDQSGVIIGGRSIESPGEYFNGKNRRNCHLEQSPKCI